MAEFDRTLLRVFVIVDSICGVALIALFVSAVVFNVLPVDPMDFDGVRLTRIETIAEKLELYTIPPLTAAIVALGLASRRGPRPAAFGALAVAGTAMLALACTVLVPWGRNEGWTNYLLGNGLLASGILAHLWLAFRLWRSPLQARESI